MTNIARRTARVAPVAVAMVGAALLLGHVAAGLVVVHVVSSLLHSVVGVIATAG